MAEQKYNPNPQAKMPIPFDNSKVSKEGKIKVGYVCGDNAGPAYYEIFVPAKHLNMKDKIYASLYQGTFQTSEVLQDDIVVFQRQVSPQALQLIRMLNDVGKKTIYHFTDNFWAIPDHNPAKSAYTPETLRQMEKIMGECTAISCTTPHLWDIASQFNDKVIHPYELIEIDEYEKYKVPGRKETDEVRIMWILTPHHQDDVYLIANVLGQIARKYPNVKFIFFGHIDRMLADSIPINQMEFYGGVQIWDYYRAAACLDGDIGIAPVINHDFNRSKSRRKWFEYSAMNICTVCSDLETYSISIEHLENAIKVKKNKAYKWLSALSFAIENPDERKRIAKNANEYVKKHHDAKVHIEKWEAMYSSLLEGDD